MEAISYAIDTGILTISVQKASEKWEIFRGNPPPVKKL